MALPILHIFAAVLNSYILWYDQVYVNVPFEKGMDSYPFRSRVLFLTLWNFVLHAVYYWIAFANDIFGTNDVSPRHPPLIRKIKDMIFALAFPLGVYVSVAFWGVYAVDKDLIFPEPVEKAYPPWINHPLHTLVSIFITIEMLTSNITYPRRKLGLAIINVFIFSYLVFLFIVYGQTVYVNVFYGNSLDTYPFKSRILFLTLWNFVLHGFYHWVAFANDVFGTDEASPRNPPLIRKLKDLLFTIAFPLGVYVSIAFWSVYAVDKELIFPEHVEKAYPPWINHPLHTFVSVFIIIEMLTSNVTYPRRMVNGCTLYWRTSIGLSE
ncbi:unnamed protein product [Pieris brassicae]|uniref:Uncharacterized protein n=1 Tax=Pieris brassicae TaxID=7116 RepID=A0A9P0SF42_PIEBR|nr:unnamed protein product [Pieris brassicae]